MFRKLFLFALVLALTMGASAYSQTVDDLIKKNVDAHGGVEKMKAVKSAQMSGKASFPGGVEAQFSLMKKRPGSVRIEFEMQGMKGIQAYDGQSGWAVNPFQGVKDPQKMNEEDLKDIQEQADFDGPLVDYKNKGNTIELVGKEDVEGTEAQKLKLTLKNGEVRYLYLDPDSGLELKETTIIKREGVERSFDTFFGDYKTVEGLVFPMSIELKMQGQPGPAYTIEKVELNTDLADTLFEMPAAPAQSQPSN